MTPAPEEVRTWLTNLRWSLKDMFDIEDMASAGWGASDIAEAFFTSADVIAELCQRNGIHLQSSSRRN